MCGIFHLWIFGISSLREKEILSVKSEQIPQTAMKGERGPGRKKATVRQPWHGLLRTGARGTWGGPAELRIPPL